MYCQYQDIRRKPLNMGSYSETNLSDNLAKTKIEMEENYSQTAIKVEHAALTSDTKNFQSAVMKIGDDQFPEFYIKHNKEEYMTWEEGTSSSRNMEINPVPHDVAGSSSPYQLTSEVDLGVMKMEEDEDIFSESNDGEDSESEQHSATGRFNLIRTDGKKFEKAFQCITCEKEFSCKRELDGHIVARHRNDGEMMNSVTRKIYRCKYCKYITIYGSNFMKHMRTHGENLETTFNCKICKKGFANKCALDSHIVARHSNDGEMMNSVTSKIHRCKYCKYIAVHGRNLMKHMRTHRENLGTTFDCALDSHSNNDEIMNCVTSKVYRCEYCKYVTVYTEDLSYHMRTHGKKIKKTIDCTKCNKEYSSKQHLDSHIVTQHSNNEEMMNSVTSKIHHCQYCKYITVYANILARHIRMHGGKLEKTFECTKCKKEFSCKKYLDAHIVTQHSNNDEMMSSVTNKMPHCQYCGYTTVHASTFVQHMRRHGEKLGKTFDCKKCEKEFPTKQILDSHIVTHHCNNGEMMNSITSKLHRCKHCLYITVHASRLTRHMRSHGESRKKSM